MLGRGSLLSIKRPKREAGHLPQSSAKVKKQYAYTSTPPYVFILQCLAKHLLWDMKLQGTVLHKLSKINIEIGGSGFLNIIFLSYYSYEILTAVELHWSV